MASANKVSIVWSAQERAYWLLKGETRELLIPDSPTWFSWLARVTAFTFQGKAGAYRARRARDSHYWYAYAHGAGRPCKRYLGRTESLTSTCLERIASLFGPQPQDRYDEAQETPSLSDEANHPHTQDLLACKFQIPHLPDRLVYREALLARLGRALESPLTLITAPAGSGKTTLLSMWLQNVQVPVAWVSLSAREENATHFWAYLLAALNSAAPGLCESALLLLRSPRPPQIETVLTPVINRLTQSTGKLVLVLDDYHLITNPDIHRSLLFFLEHLPPGLHLVIATREDPPLSLARLRAAGRLLELRFNDLRFTRREIVAFFKAVAGLDLAPPEIDALDRQTEGWVVGLQLAALSLRDQPDAARADFIRNFTGGHRYIVDYLVQEVLARLPARVQTFLLLTSILERLHGPLCEAVTGQQHGQEQLEALERANLFVLPLDEERRWYRYHQLFADMLRKRLESQSCHPGSADGLPSPAELHRRAATWYEQHNYFTEAISHLKAAGDLNTVVRLIEEHGRDLIQRGEVATVLRWTSDLSPELLRTRLSLGLIHARALVYCGLHDAAQAALLDVEHLLRSSEESGTTPQLQQMQGEVFALSALLASYQSDLNTTLMLIERAQSCLSHSPDLHSIVALSRGTIYRRCGDDERAYAGFVQARALSRAQNMYVEMISIANIGNILYKRGQLHEAVHIYQQAISLNHSGYAIPASCIAYLGLGEIFYEWNDLEGASKHLQQGLEMARLWEYAGMIVEISAALTLVQRAQRLEQAGSDLLREAEKLTRRNQDMVALMYLFVFRAYLALLDGDLEMALRWERELDMNVMLRYGAAPLLFYYLVLARLEIARGEFEQAQALLARLQEQEEAQQHTHNCIRILLLQTLACLGQQQVSQALEKLAQALALAGPEGYTRAFVDQGPALLPLLLSLHKRLRRERWDLPWSVSPDYLDRLLALMDTSTATAGRCALPVPAVIRQRVPAMDCRLPAPTTVGAALPGSAAAPSLSSGLHLEEPLSQRELEILGLIAAGYANSEIAAQLVVAQSTVKSHVNSIYRKLQARSRAQAIARARALHLV